MAKVICLVIGLAIGGFLGVMFMCIMQINTINRYESKINMLQKELEDSKKMVARIE